MWLVLTVIGTKQVPTALSATASKLVDNTGARGLNRPHIAITYDYFIIRRNEQHMQSIGFIKETEYALPDSTMIARTRRTCVFAPSAPKCSLSIILCFLYT